MSSAPFYPNDPANVSNPKGLFEIACSMWLPSQLKSMLATLNYEADDRKYTEAQLAEGWCYTLAGTALPDLAQGPLQAAVDACRRGIAAAGAVPANAWPDAGPGET